MSPPDPNQTAEFDPPTGQAPIQPPSSSLPERRPTLATRNLPIPTSAFPFRSVDQDNSFGIPPSHLWSATPNRHTPAVQQHLSPAPSSLLYTSTSPASSSTLSSNLAGPSTSQETLLARHNYPSSISLSNSSRSTLLWGGLEAWMDEEYAKQVCGIMGWDPVNVKVPAPAPDSTTGQQANNAGYCYLTFPTTSHAASVLAQIGTTGQSMTMPNSNKPFVINWSSSVPPTGALPSPTIPANPGIHQQYPQEYSIFVGDLAPETSNSDLVAVFRNPVLGLRNDRAPKFIRPFLSCKSAKIMLDPVTGVSRGYGFVRFTDENDQQRALVEMHGLYCLSRPMRISPATAKFKPALPPLSFHPQSADGGLDSKQAPITIALPLSGLNQSKSVSAPIASTSSNISLPGNGASGSTSGSSIGGSASTSSLTTGTTSSSASMSSSGFGSATSEDMLNLPNDVLVQIAQQYANGSNNRSAGNGGNSIAISFAQDGQQDGAAPRYTISEESWKHHAQARAILGNLIGPNGEQLTSTDPYNTTVFVGGLSPLISEDTLRTFFAPFGDIHYVKVPVGKHCGFVQFVRKADAERAIEKMQGFPIGGSRIRLSWGRSQYKAAQAAAQAAQAAAFQAQYQAQVIAPPSTAISPEQAYQLLQKFGVQARIDPNQQTVVIEPNPHPNDNSSTSVARFNADDQQTQIPLTAHKDDSTVFPFDPYTSAVHFGRQPSVFSFTSPSQHRPQPISTFSPFSPDPNQYTESSKRLPFSRTDLLPHPSRNYAPGFGPIPQEGTNGKSSPTTRPPSRSRYGSYLDDSVTAFQTTKQTTPEQEGTVLSRPSSGQTSSGSRGFEGVEHDSIQDLNGTLASLDLDQTNPPWNSPVVNSRPEMPSWSMSRLQPNKSPHRTSPPP